MSFLRKKTEKRSIYTVDDSPCGVGLINSVLDINSFPALSLSAIYGATSIISNSIALLPITVTQHKKNKALILDEHPVYHMFDNTLMTKYTTIKTMVMDLLLHGNSYAYIERDADGNISRLRYISFNDVTVNYDELNEKLSYTISKLKKTNIPARDIIHLNINAADGVHGRGILFFAAKTISLSKYTDRSAEHFFSTGCQVNGILSTDAPRLTDQQRKDIKQAWIQSQTGDGSGIAVLEAGMNYSPVSANAKDSQMIETRLFNLQEICRFFNLSPIMLGDLTHTQYGSIEQAQIEFVQHCLMPFIEMIENEFDRKILLNKANLHINFDTNVLLKSDKQSEANYITTLVTNGIWTINEGRSVLGYNPIDGGEKIVVPFTNIEDNTVAEQGE